ncbi:hypothetical protein PRK78_000027 [Emydomyces testavorans]|uniref:Uncharacterized protein n=1 Tax=Emydomyces testavorans TaxID=2070801 RepID=A0AAF0DBT0_9EURO|nr:hypothetical protein PRK78_000027 [Emydomyces testavorans]
MTDTTPINNAMKAKLDGLLRPIKVMITPDNKEPSPDKMDKFVSKILLRWKPGQVSRVPSPRDPIAHFDDTAVPIGVLVKDLPTSETTKASKKLPNPVEAQLAQLQEQVLDCY